MRQRPFLMAGWRQAPPQRVRAPQRGAARKSPGRLPFFRRPRRPGGRVPGTGFESEGWSPCSAGTDSRGAAEGDAEQPTKFLRRLNIAPSRFLLSSLRTYIVPTVPSVNGGLALCR